jgi:hypothetical protein
MKFLLITILLTGIPYCLYASSAPADDAYKQGTLFSGLPEQEIAPARDTESTEPADLKMTPINSDVQLLKESPVIQENSSGERDHQVATQPSVSAEILDGFDTVDIEEGGNWLLKRKALEDTIDVIEKIHKVFTQILESRMDFKIRQTQFENEFDLFIGAIGFDLGDLEKTLMVLLDQMEKERNQEGDLSEKEREVMQELATRKAELQDLQSSMKMLHESETKIDDVMMTIEQQINTANSYQNQAWLNFQTIKKVLSDEKAEELYYSTESLYKSLLDVQSYLKGSLAQYFNQQLESLKEHMNKVKESIKQLQEKGIDIKKEVDRFEAQDIEKEQENINHDQEEAVKKAVADVKREQSEGFFARMIKGVTAFFQGIVGTLVNFFATIKHMIVGTAKIKTETRQLSAQEPVAQTGQ